jgi:hypothetical protein
MGRTALRRAIVVLTAALVLTVTFSSGAHAADAGLTAAMLDTGDLPAGFTPDASLTGPLTGQLVRALGLNPAQTWSRDIEVRTWRAADGAEVTETAVDAGTGGHARAGAASEVSDLEKQGATRQPVAGFDVYGGFVGPYFELVLPLARGPYLLGLHVLVPPSSAGSAGRLMSDIGAAQVRKVPADTPDTTPASDAFGAAGLAVGVLIGYLLLAAGVGYLRDPLRRETGRTGARPVRPGPGGDGGDVSAAARQNLRIAAGRLAVQLGGLGLVAYAADVFAVRYWYAYLVAGLAALWAGGRLIRPGGAGRDRNRAVMAGPHLILVTVMRVAAAAMILFGLAAIVCYGVYRTQPHGATVQGLPGLRVPDLRLPGLGLPGLGLPGLGLREPGLLVLGLPGLGLLVLGAIMFRVARRLRSADARRLMLRDPRPPVLYLRSFGDGSLKLRLATLGRPTLVERFTWRRLDTFEEVLVRHLSRYGPVIAVNPPGTRLVPLRAARETVDPPAGQPAVANWMAAWMAQSALIVFQAPPSQATLQLHWELRTVAEHGQWDKVLVVVPPVPAEQLRARWRAFGRANAGFWPYTVADPHALLLAFRHGGWDVTSADRRTEWSYSAALEHVLGEPRWLAAPHADGPRPRAGLGPLTLPVAALIIVVAAVMTGAGTWYAMGQAPAAQLSVVARQSASPSLAPPRPLPADSSRRTARTASRARTGR